MSGSSNAPIDGQVFMLASAKASVDPGTLSELLSCVQSYLDDRRDTYRREFERVVESDDREVFLVPTGHWETLGDQFDTNDRETKAIARTHAEQLRRIGSETGRDEEFETALEIREAVVIGR